jgi:hypothetical protein
LDQDFLVYIILATTIGLIFYSFVKSLKRKETTANGCGGCTGCELHKYNRGCNNSEILADCNTKQNSLRHNH